MDTSKSPYARLRPVPVSAVRVTGGFWAGWLKRLREVTLPSQYRLLEETGRIDNFRRASGKVSGGFRGLYFNDSDVYKWVEAASYALAYRPSDRLKRMLDTVIREIRDAQDEDGYLNTYFTFERRDERWKNLRDMHELYCAGHLFQAAIAHYRATGERILLNVALKFADHISKAFGHGKCKGVPGHPEIEMALVELYRETGRSNYLKLAGFFLDMRGRGLIGGSEYHVDHKPFRELTEAVGHAVRFMYLMCGAADLYMETGEDALYKALDKLWVSVARRKMYPTGGLGSRYSGEAFGEDYELPDRRAYAETCAAVANVMLNWRMLLATGEVRFTDVMELALYNGALSGISLNGERYFYVNPLAEMGFRRRQRWFRCACCPPNIARLIASIPGYVYGLSEEGIWVHLYVQNEACLMFKGERVKLVQFTDYPWSGDVNLTVKPEKPTEFTLFLRIPGWCKEASISVNGKAVEAPIIPGSYVEVRRVWKPGDSVKVSMQIPVRLMETHPHVLSSSGRVFLKRGPIVYCFEQVDNSGFHVWSLAVKANVEFNVKYEPDLLGGVCVVEGGGYTVDEGAWGGKLYLPVEEAPRRLRAVRFRAIPYYAWANREPGPMVVWIRLIKKGINRVERFLEPSSQ